MQASRIIAVVTLCLLGTGSLTHAGAQQREAAASKRILTLESAKTIVAAAQEEARKNGWPGAIAVVDDGGWLIVAERMDNAATTVGPSIAVEKARTAALFKRPSADLENAINNGRPAAITAPGLVMMEGGLPIVIDGQVVGAIGVSADTKVHDSQIARAGLAVLKP
ncbi:heme-binding protein [Herbaspirillum sp. RV1423]|uniref:GlcG/HbpS family heme-binding protein n=1 Tax=Herbaspirillum sp. RV1423 TaxID=1443993 RepID=UPI0004AF7914|nr:heme-binding protein [Herbaspirillum sp. RV1423]